jgi:hypothetical protein
VNYDDVLLRVDVLRHMNDEHQQDKWRIRSIMDGGAEGIAAVLAWDYGKGASMSASGRILDQLGVDMPTVNLVASGNERFAQMIADVPTLKAPIANDKDDQKRNQKRIEIVAGWDEEAELELQYPQIGRWLPGYSYVMWRITQRRNTYGEWYPYAELKDPFDVYPGWFGADQQPSEAATVRVVPLGALMHAYPEQNWDRLSAKIQNGRKVGGAMTADSRSAANQTRSWEGKRSGVEVYEYYCGDGNYICIPEVEAVINHIPNPLESGPLFVFAKRFSYNRNVSQYHHVIGIQSMLAKLTVIGLIANEEAVFRPTNIFGEMVGDEYDMGRLGINEFENNARVERPQVENQAGVWAQIDRLERMLRIGSGYDVQQDSISPNSFATGAGMRELQGATNEHAREYQKVLRAAQKRIDARRLEWAQKMYPIQERTFYDMYGKRQTYRAAKAIRGDYRTRRTSGPLASFDAQNKLVMGLNLVQGEALSLESFQETIEGIDNPLVERERIAERRATQTMFGRLAGLPPEDPRVDAALAEIMQNPDREKEILIKYFAPEEPQPGQDEMAQLQQLAMGGGQPAPPQQEGIATVLARAEAGGQSEAGVQRVGNL